MSKQDYIVYKGFKYFRSDEAADEVKADSDEKKDEEVKTDAEVIVSDSTPASVTDDTKDELFADKKIISLLEEIVTLLKSRS